MIEHIKNIKRPVKVGERFLVPCFVREDEDTTYITPVIDHPHSDKENGQPLVHYHADYRFVKHNAGVVENRHKKYYFVDDIRLVEGINGKIEDFILPVINEQFAAITPVELIAKSKIKHKCIHKGKCPHRGYDLSQVTPVNGVITCPLHGLQFDAITKEILNFENTH